MELLLVKEGLWPIVNEAKPEDAAASWATKDGAARATIGLALDDSQLSHVMGAVSANDMWKKLKSYHERGSLANKIHVLRKLCSVRLTEGGNMSDHLAEICLLVHKLLGMGERLEEHWIVAILLSSLPNSYNPLITALEGHPEADMNMEYVKGKLLDEWRRRCENDAEEDSAQSSAMRADIRRRETMSDGRTERRVCFYCQNEGHFRRDCPRLMSDRRAQEERRQREGMSPSSRTGRGGGGSGRSVCFTTMTKIDRAFRGWMIDSGCTRHMTGDIRNLKNVVPCREMVSLADGRNLPVQAAGECEFAGCDMDGNRMDVKLKNVLYVPGLSANVMSVSRMVDEGYAVCFGSGDCRILNGDKVVLVGERRGPLFFAKEACL